jgi:hypothetical protein
LRSRGNNWPRAHNLLLRAVQISPEHQASLPT